MPSASINCDLERKRGRMKTKKVRKGKEGKEGKRERERERKGIAK